MTDSANPNRRSTGAGKSAWASKFAARYRCELSQDLVRWFDDEVWNQSGRGEYRQPIHVEELLVDAPEAVWPALMPCDLLPISGNTAGDWLCLRIGPDNVASEIVQWYHGGGDWIPWGRTLAEAIIFDVLSVNLPGPLRRHSVPAESPRLDSDVTGVQLHADPLLDWASSHVPSEVSQLIGDTTDGQSISEKMLRRGISEVAVRCEAVQDAIHHSIASALDPKLAAKWDVAWEEMIEWTFDANRIPPERRTQVEEHLGRELEEEQDWATAERHCRAVTEIDSELAWPWEILGYAAERAGDIEAAVSAYTRASQCSVFTDQSVRLRTHWTGDSVAKFSVARLLSLQSSKVKHDNYLSRLCIEDIAQRRREVCEHWRRLAEESSQQGCFADAYRFEMAAGWDLGAEPMMTFGKLLESIVDVADKAGFVARAELARTHRACLAARYRI